jgi:wyosine [tRNA(Phe)-imidazoG37] synthetase (radical SAM superfamily)
MTTIRRFNQICLRMSNECAGTGICKTAGHMAIPLQQHIVYGPVRSRRLGRSLGINLLPIGFKVCNMNCAYCQYGWTGGQRRTTPRAPAWPSPAQVGAAVSARLKRAEKTGELLDRLTVAGHGEPTLHPQFEDIVGRLIDLRDRLAPTLRIGVLSNSTTAAWPGVRRALSLFDDRYMKLDAGDPITYAHVNGLGTSIGTIVDALRNLPRIVVQAMFVTDGIGRVDNTTEGALHEWLAALDEIQPAGVQIYTLDRPPALEGLRAVPMRRLREIAERVRAKEIPADVFTSTSDARTARR